MSKCLHVVFSIAINALIILSQNCEYDFRLSYKHSQNSDWTKRTVTGCVSDKTFLPERVTELLMACEEISLFILEKNFISNMQDLRELTIQRCYINRIEPGAFSNLPQLTTIRILFDIFKTVPSGVFSVLPSLQYIFLTNNRLSYIEDNAFSNLPNLRGIFLDNCRLDYIRREWFTNTSNIDHFAAYRNSIRRVPAGMFHGWKKLKMVNLNSNAISVIEGAIFNDNPSLIRNLDLHHNRLRSLSPDLLPDSIFIEHFSVSANLLNFIPEKLLKKIRAANMVIFSNPFSCPCLDKINEILLERGVKVDNTFFPYVATCKNSDVPVCGRISNFSTSCVEAVDEVLTKKIIAQMKDIGYDTVYDQFNQQCAMFDDLN